MLPHTNNCSRNHNQGMNSLIVIHISQFEWNSSRDLNAKYFQPYEPEE